MRQFAINDYLCSDMEKFERLLAIMDRLRVECPWDREQTIQSLRNNTIEETYELTDAIAAEDWDAIRQELGDLLLHVVFYAKIASEQSRFGIGEVIDGLCEKLIFRHPHVFADASDLDLPQNSEQVSKNWESLKLKEKNRRPGVLSGVPRGLPAVVKAYRISQKAAASGFDWQRREDVWDKVDEELSEVRAESTHDRLEDEFGDLLFAIVNAARLYGVDPEMALERTNRKFITRFEHIERRAAELGRPLRELSPDEMENYWQEAKNGTNQETPRH